MRKSLFECAFGDDQIDPFKKVLGKADFLNTKTSIGKQFARAENVGAILGGLVVIGSCLGFVIRLLPDKK
jgi:hypothetical protein